MLLEGKNAVVYGAAGSVGSAVARAFSREGATVFLAGRTSARLDAVAETIERAGGSVATAAVDALDENRRPTRRRDRRVRRQPGRLVQRDCR